MRLFEGTPFDIPPTCDRCGALEAECNCPPIVEREPLVPPESQTATIFEEKRKKGKVVTVIQGLVDQRSELPDLLTRLKNECGAGGAIKDGSLELQGKHLSRVEQALKRIGYRIRRRG